MPWNPITLVRRFFALLWRTITWIRISLANLIFIILILVIINALIPEKEREMPDSIALRVAPSGFLVDQYSYIDPLTQILNRSGDQPLETLVRDLVKTINSAANDARVTALVLDLNDLFGGGLSKLQEVGAALRAFKLSGKPIYAVSDSFTQEQYYLASFADQIVMHPMGAMLLIGYSNYRQYFKSAIDKLSLNMHVFRAGEFKDAVEPLLRDDMSDASREHNSRWLTELWSNYTRDVESQRSLDTGTIDDYINRMHIHMAENSGDSASAAQAAGIVDTLSTHNEQEDWLVDKLGKGENDTGYRALDYSHYLHFIKREEGSKAKTGAVGLVVARGMILDGEQPAGTIGSESLVQLIRKAREDDNIKALVLRVDSGGGSAFASEVIRQELAATRNGGKPVLVSMGTVAASGGYWISMGADEVWATPSTLTGSIGVFSAFPTLESSLEKLGINSDGVSTTKLGDALRLDRPLSPLAANLVQQSVDSIYERFLNLVAEARNSTPEQVNVIGQGRVWTGSAAKQLGLVDELGQLEDVVAAAATRAGLEQYQVIEISKPLTPAEQLAQKLTRKFTFLNIQWSPPATPLNRFWQQTERQLQPIIALLGLEDPRAVYAQCLDCVSP